MTVKSAGNDIVALELIDKERSERPAFYSKILSTDEQALYKRKESGEMPFEIYLWLLWSIKESVYKYKKRSSPGLSFCPAKIIVQHIDPPSGPSPAISPGPWDIDSYEGDELYEGRILFGSEVFYSRSMIHKEWIATVAGDDNRFEGISWGVKMIGRAEYEHQSASVREFVLAKLELLSPGHDWQITKNQVGCPILVKSGAPLNIPLSLAHHDRYVAYSFPSGHPQFSSPHPQSPVPHQRLQRMTGT